eukprot:1353531-Prymnesium_polylepis.1
MAVGGEREVADREKAQQERSADVSEHHPQGGRLAKSREHVGGDVRPRAACDPPERRLQQIRKLDVRERLARCAASSNCCALPASTASFARWWNASSCCLSCRSKYSSVRSKMEQASEPDRVMATAQQRCMWDVTTCAVSAVMPSISILVSVNVHSTMTDVAEAFETSCHTASSVSSIASTHLPSPSSMFFVNGCSSTMKSVESTSNALE